MPDIFAIKRRDLVYLVAETAKGKSWLSSNLITSRAVVSIPAELEEEMIKEIQEADLTIERTT